MMRRIIAAAVGVMCLVLTGCGGGNDENVETTVSSATDLHPTAELLVSKQSPSHITDFPTVIAILERDGFECSNVEDRTDDPSWGEGSSGKVDVDELGTVWFFISEIPDSMVARSLSILEGDSDLSHTIVGENWYLNIYSQGSDTAAISLAESLRGSVFIYSK